jgi:cytochrome c-type biogenesis protein CcmH
MKRKLLKLAHVGLLLMLVAGIASTVYAQDGGVRTITDDEVNAIARKLYCPVCENITLDTCGTAACADWRYEIRLQLEGGSTEEQIIEDFVRRFGDRVVGTPLDPTLRAISLFTPWIIIAAALVSAAVVLARRKRAQPTTAVVTASGATNRYQDLFEQDIANS